MKIPQTNNGWGIFDEGKKRNDGTFLPAEVSGWGWKEYDSGFGVGDSKGNQVQIDGQRSSRSRNSEEFLGSSHYGFRHDMPEPIPSICT